MLVILPLLASIFIRDLKQLSYFSWIFFVFVIVSIVAITVFSIKEIMTIGDKELTYTTDEGEVVTIQGDDMN